MLQVNTDRGAVALKRVEAWLKAIAEHEDINSYSVLQKSLKQELHLA